MGGAGLLAGRVGLRCRLNPTRPTLSSIEAVAETSSSQPYQYHHLCVAPSRRLSPHSRFLSYRGFTSHTPQVGLDTRRLSAGRVRVGRFSIRG
ncbi:hypothetical protein PIB30_033380 [Stylosanthes scabra]|uniref:Uncharacterized protein n=1 Tax=Stylosanthes scabra TaxID=79078 RepID=A0ABU6ZB60_9FABA|nr:hypothetical protein [Stylosanthes scabra]